MSGRSNHKLGSVCPSRLCPCLGESTCSRLPRPEASPYSSLVFCRERLVMAGCPGGVWTATPGARRGPQTYRRAFSLLTWVKCSLKRFGRTPRPVRLGLTNHYGSASRFGLFFGKEREVKGGWRGRDLPAWGSYAAYLTGVAFV